MTVYRSIVKRSIGVSTLVLAALLLVVLEVFAIPTSFQWRSYDGGGSTSYGVYDSDNSTPLAGGDLLQLIYIGVDGEIDPPDASGAPTDDDVLLDTGAILDNASLPPPLQDRGYFDELLGYDTDDWSDGTVVYVRAWNDSTAESATHYGDSSTSTLSNGGTFNFPRWHTGTSGPTAVTLASFTATGGDTQVLVQWETASEINTAGFNLYRSGYSNGIEQGHLISLNNGLIPGQALGSPSGASYNYTDTDIKPGATYYYWLEDVEVTGSTHLHGPVSATLPRSRPYLPLIMKR